MKAYREHILVYVDGIRIPVLGYRIDNGVGEVPTCVIHCYPDLNLANLAVRAHVVVFHKGEAMTDYRMVFEGELENPALQYSEAGISLSLICKGLLNHLTSMSVGFVTLDLEPALSRAIKTMVGQSSAAAKVLDAGHERFIRVTNTIIEEGTLPAGLAKFMENVYDVNSFWQNKLRAFKMSDRFFTPPTLLSDFLGEQYKNSLSSIAGLIPRQGKVLDIVKAVCLLIYYDVITNLSRIERSIIVKPNSKWLNPPICNVLLPGMYGNIPPFGPTLSTPTRMIFEGHDLVNESKGQGVTDKGTSQVSPFARCTLCYLQDGKFQHEELPAGLELDSTYLEKFKEELHDEEERKGIVLEYLKVSSYARNAVAAIMQSVAIQKAVPAKGTKYSDLVPEQDGDLQLYYHLFFSTRYRGSIQINGPYNPHAQPGFPLLMVYSEMSGGTRSSRFMLGYLSKVSSGCYKDRESYTRYLVTYPIDLHRDARPYPIWIGASTDFSDDGISRVYQDMLGCDSLYDTFPPKEEDELKTPADIILRSGEKLIADYMGQEDQPAFRCALLDRDRMTPDDYFKALGCTKISADEWTHSGTLFCDKNRELLRNYVAAMEEGVGVL